MEKNRILFLSPLPPPYYGSAKSSQTCLDILRENGSFNVVNIKLNYSENFDDLGKMSLKKLFGFFNVIFKSIYIIISFKPNLIYLMPATSGAGLIRDFLISIPLKFFNIKVLYHLRTQITKEENKSKVKRFIFKVFFFRSKIIVLGQNLVYELSDYVLQKNIFVLPNGIYGTLSDHDYQKLVSKRNEKKHLNLLFLSNMMKSKGWIKTLDAALLLKSQNVDFHLNFAGNWVNKNDEDFFYNFIREHHLQENVSYVGYIDDIKKHTFLSDTHILIFPTEYEAFGRVIIESMEYGIAVIANSVGSIPNILVHNETGFLLKENTPQEICYYINFLTDIRIRNTIGDLGRKRFASNYELSVFKKNFLDIIYQAVN